MPCNDTKDFHGLTSLSEGWSCAQVKGVYEEAIRFAKCRISSLDEIPCVCSQDLFHALRNVGPSEIDFPNEFKNWALQLRHATK